MPATKPASRFSTDPASWRREQLGKLGIKGDLGRFLADTRVDVARIRKMIEAGATPLDAVRIEAGRDNAGDDPLFDHATFDLLLAAEIPF